MTQDLGASSGIQCSAKYPFLRAGSSWCIGQNEGRGSGEKSGTIGPTKWCKRVERQSWVWTRRRQSVIDNSKGKGEGGGNLCRETVSGGRGKPIFCHG